MMTRTLPALLFFLLILSSCDKEEQKRMITYHVDKAYSPLEITYRNETGEIITLTKTFHSIEDKWNYSFKSGRNEIVYLSAVYSDSLSSAAVAIIIDGKVFREKYSEKEPFRPVTVSGTIP